MDSPAFPRICKTCGQPYVVDDSCDTHMNPPYDYGRGFSRYCLACWLGVGPKDNPDTEYTEIDGREDAFVGFSADSEIPKIRELQRIFEKNFKPEQETPWQAFLDRFGKSEGRICYYPSAGSDFRPLVYQQLSGMAELGLVNAKGGIVRPGADLFSDSSYTAPDLWIHSDFRGDHLTEWLETKLVHQDGRVEIRLLTHTEIHPQWMNFQQIPSKEYTSLPPTEMTGRVFFLRLAVANETIGIVECDVLYFCVENVDLIQSFLLRRPVPLSHVVWVRDGAAFGGGRMRLDFLIPLLTSFRTRWLFLQDHYLEDRREVKWPRELRSHERLLGLQSPDLHPVGLFQSGDDRVAFCEVDSTRANEVVANERHMQEERNKPEPSVFLWLCCEGWMKFGPFEWLRFDDESQAILGPDGDKIAEKTGGHWRVPGEKWQGWGFSNPTITTTPVHPHKNSSSHPTLNR